MLAAALETDGTAVSISLFPHLTLSKKTLRRDTVYPVYTDTVCARDPDFWPVAGGEGVEALRVETVLSGFQ